MGMVDKPNCNWCGLKPEEDTWYIFEKTRVLCYTCVKNGGSFGKRTGMAPQQRID